MIFRTCLLTLAIVIFRTPTLFSQGGSDIHWIDWPDDRYSYGYISFAPDNSLLCAYDFYGQTLLFYSTSDPVVMHRIKTPFAPLSFRTDTSIVTFQAISMYDTSLKRQIASQVFEEISMNGTTAELLKTDQAGYGLYASGVAAYSSTYNDSVWSVDLRTGVKHLYPLPRDFSRSTRGVLSGDGSILAISQWGYLSVYETSTGKLIWEDTVPGIGNTYSFEMITPDNKSLVHLGFDRVLKVFDLASGKMDRRIISSVLTNSQSQSVYDIAVSSDGSYIAATAHDGTIHLWDFRTGEELHVYDDYPGVHTKLAFSPDNRYVASVTMDGAVILWNGPEIVLGVESDREREGSNLQCTVVPGGSEVLFEIALPHSGRAVLDVFDLNGRPVARPLDERLDAGDHVVELSTGELSNGVYFYRLTASHETVAGRLVVAR